MFNIAGGREGRSSHLNELKIANFPKLLTSSLMTLKTFQSKTRIHLSAKILKSMWKISSDSASACRQNLTWFGNDRISSVSGEGSAKSSGFPLLPLGRMLRAIPF